MLVVPEIQSPGPSRGATTTRGRDSCDCTNLQQDMKRVKMKVTLTVRSSEITVTD